MTFASHADKNVHHCLHITLNQSSTQQAATLLYVSLLVELNSAGIKFAERPKIKAMHCLPIYL